MRNQKSPSDSLQLACLLLAAGASAAQAQVMLSPVAATTDIATYNDNLSVTNMINQSGVETPFTSGVTSFATYFSNPSLMWANSGDGGTNNWMSQLTFSASSYQGYIDFDLGAVYSINSLAIWNQSLKDITVKVLTDLGGPEQTVGSFTLINRQNYFSSYPVDLVSFGSTFSGRYVRVLVDSIYPIQGFTFGYVLVGEVVASVSAGGAPPPPSLSIARETNGNVTVTFTGTLQTSTNVTGNYTDVSGGPASPYTIAKTNFLPAQFFRARN
ncbi:MAG: hypothetical protein U1F65_12410 [Verrucomicrobiota bacterium]